jgi:tetratricopeptide (TPR) repeat protein
MGLTYADIVGLYTQGKYREAFDSAEDALQQQPNDFDLLNAAGSSANACGLTEPAERYWKMAALIRPDSTATFFNLGVLFSVCNRQEEAEASYRHALALDNTYIGAHINLGALLQQSGRYAEAENSFRHIIAINPDDCRAWFNLAHVLSALGRRDEAEASYRMILSKDPNHADACNNLGAMLHQSHKFAEAESFFLQALAVKKDFADAHRNLGLLYQDLKQFENAEICFRNARSVDPNNREAEWSLGMLLLRLGRYAEGWQHYEARYHPDLKGRTIFPPVNPYPKWQGEPLVGKSIAVWSEQGMGDDIQFCRFLPVLKALGASTVTFVCKPLLAHLMQTASGVDRLVVRGTTDDMPQHDYWTLLHSIPCHANILLDSIPSRTPYLFAKSPYLEETSTALKNTGGFKVGICWKGSPGFILDADRSPGIKPFKRLFTIPGVRFVTVVPGGREELITSAQETAYDLGREVGETTPPFEETAALITAVDLMITSDTAIAHLAGALGKPTWAVLPYSACWRWLEEREDSPWYPNTQLFRQSERGNWTEVFERVAVKLESVIAAQGEQGDNQP